MTRAGKHLKQSAGWRYWFDFWFFPATATLIAAIYCRSAAWIGGVTAGFALWTFVEYWVHRSLLHVYFWEGTHEEHHLRPREYVTFPLWYLPGFFAIAFAVMPTWLLCGFMLGYCWFITMHHWLHHIDLIRSPRWLQNYAIWHNRHHKATRCNYGITTPVWDRVFRTSL